jgi:hypothetical protein
MIKIICTGNPNEEGISKALQQLYPNTMFVSRKSGYDLLTADGINKFIQLVKEYNVFVNCSQVAFGIQEKLLNIVIQQWTEGNIFNIGSVLEFNKWQHLDIITSQEKLRLRDASINACTSKLKTTHMIVSGFRDRSNADISRMDPMRIVEAIQWVLNSEAHIPLISIAKVEC